MSGPPPKDSLLASYDPLPEPDYDHLDFSFQDMTSDDCHENDYPQKSAQGYSEYILGTLVVRVVAARDLEPAQNGGLRQIFFGNNRSKRELRSNRSRRSGSGASANPYASVRYCRQSQRTTECYDTLDPIWPRGETMFFDVSLPVSNMVQEERLQDPTRLNPDYIDNRQRAPANQPSIPPPPEPILTVALFHANESYSKLEKYPKKSSKSGQGDSDDPFLGVASVDVTHVLTGKSRSFDDWVPLFGTENSRGRVRIVCEYEATDPPPRVGDKLRFSSYCKPADLYPVPAGLLYVVQETDGDELILSYNSPEGWPCTFAAHRFMFICEERHLTAVETYQQELASFTERLAYSPLVSTVAETVERVEDDGLLFVGVDAVKEGASLLTRWLKGGVGTAVGDVVYATNFDGRFNPDHLHGNLALEDESDAEEQQSEVVQEETAVIEEDVTDESEPLPGMPCCPITGEPMRDPVVAADGHTYERTAITRWFQTSNTSPLTGSVLPHKNLVTNYMLLSSLQGDATTATQEAM